MIVRIFVLFVIPILFFCPPGQKGSISLAAGLWKSTVGPGNLVSGRAAI